MNEKMKFAKCPYCNATYNDFSQLTPLATHGWERDRDVICPACGERFRISVKITYYASKLKGAERITDG